MADEIADAATLAELEAVIDAWLAEQLAENPVVAAVERGEPSERRWYVRVHGERRTCSPSGSPCASGRCTTRPT